MHHMITGAFQCHVQQQQKKIYLTFICYYHFLPLRH